MECQLHSISLLLALLGRLTMLKSVCSMKTEEMSVQKDSPGPSYSACTSAMLSSFKMSCSRAHAESEAWLASKGKSATSPTPVP